MLSFALTLKRFLSAVIRSWEVPFFRAAFVLALIILLSGTSFYMSAEGWSFPDALLFAMSSVSPVGDGGIHPKTDFGKVFTVFYGFVGIGVFVALFVQFARALLKVDAATDTAEDPKE